MQVLQAGVSIGTLYEYFPDKEALLLALGRQHVASATELLDALERSWVDQPPASMLAVVEALVELLVSQHRQHPSTHQLLTTLRPAPPTFSSKQWASGLGSWQSCKPS